VPAHSPDLVELWSADVTGDFGRTLASPKTPTKYMAW
jgi:hypothetical protein